MELEPVEPSNEYEPSYVYDVPCVFAYAVLFAKRPLAEALAETDEPYEPLPTNNELIVVALAWLSFVSSRLNLLSSPIVMPISARSPAFFFVPLIISRVCLICL